MRTAHGKRAVIIGGGFAGLWAARRLAKDRNLDVILVDRNNYHTFPPLLYQVAAAELESESIAYPLRGIFRNFPNVSVVMAEVTGLDTGQKTVKTDQGDFLYDTLLIAAGSRTGFFGTPGAREHAFTLKTLEDAVCIRNHLLGCFERAAVHIAGGPAKGDPLLHVVVVGGGPTGVEYAGALSELFHTPLRRDFPEFPEQAASVTLLDAADGLLHGFPEPLRYYAQERLRQMDVRVLTGVLVTTVDKGGVTLQDGERINAATVVWSAGVRGNDLAGALGLPLGPGGRIQVMQTLEVEDFPGIFAAGDIALVKGQEHLPMVAPVAIQQGRHAGENMEACLKKIRRNPFSYHDKGTMATIGRKSAVAVLGKWRFRGFTAWVVWLSVHLAFLIGFRNRILVLLNWAWDYLFSERSVRLILPRTIPSLRKQEDGET